MNRVADTLTARPRRAATATLPNRGGPKDHPARHGQSLSALNSKAKGRKRQLPNQNSEVTMTRQEKDAHSTVVREELEALVRYCQRHKRPWPPRMNLAKRFGMSSSSLDYHMDQLIKDGRVMRIAPARFEVPQLPPVREAA